MAPVALTPARYYSYEDLLASFGVEVLTQVDQDDWQGDTLTLLRDGARYGYLEFGWGSCSGCDALEAAGSDVREVTELRDQLWDSVHWEDDAQAMTRYLRGTDWAGRWTQKSLVSTFLAAAAEHLPGLMVVDVAPPAAAIE